MTRRSAAFVVVGQWTGRGRRRATGSGCADAIYRGLCHGQLVVQLVVFMASFVGRAAVHELTMLSKGQVFVADAGRQIDAPCEFHTSEFSMFENPVIWKKIQADEETAINIMGNILDPFLATGRFEVLFNNDQIPRYQMTLRITDLLPEDSGNYTCEIRGRRSTVLAAVVHLISVRAPVTLLTFEVENHQTATKSPSVDDSSNYGELHRVSPHHQQQLHPQQHYGGGGGNNRRHESADPGNPRRVTFIEHAPRKMRCAAVGGFPLPEMQITVGTRDVTGEFSLSHSVTLDGIPGLRAISYLTERTTDKIAFTSRDDGLPIKCIVTVPGLTPNQTQVHISVLHRPVITCPPTYASIGDRNVALRCEVSALPSPTALFWIIDGNGTTVSSGQVVNEYWTLVMDRSDGIMETQLFMKQVLSNSYRRYTLVAENSIAANTAEAQLVPKPRKTSDSMSPPPHTATPNAVHNGDVIVQPRDVAKRLNTADEYQRIRLAMTSSGSKLVELRHSERTNIILCLAILAIIAARLQFYHDVTAT